MITGYLGRSADRITDLIVKRAYTHKLFLYSVFWCCNSFYFLDFNLEPIICDAISSKFYFSMFACFNELVSMKTYIIYILLSDTGPHSSLFFVLSLSVLRFLSNYRNFPSSPISLLPLVKRSAFKIGSDHPFEPILGHLSISEKFSSIEHDRLCQFQTDHQEFTFSKRVVTTKNKTQGLLHNHED